MLFDSLALLFTEWMVGGLIVWLVATILFWVIAYGYYAHSMVAGKVKPRLAFWLAIVVIDYFAFFALVRLNVRGQAMTQIFTWAIGSTIILLMVLVREKVFKFNPVDKLCLGMAFLGMVLWALTSQPELALLLQLGAMVAATVPFWQNALLGREGWWFCILTTLGSACALGTVSVWSMASWQKSATPVFGVIHSSVSLAICIVGSIRASPSI